MVQFFFRKKGSREILFLFDSGLIISVLFKNLGSYVILYYSGFFPNSNLWIRCNFISVPLFVANEDIFWFDITICSYSM